MMIFWLHICESGIGKYSGSCITGLQSYAKLLGCHLWRLFGLGSVEPAGKAQGFSLDVRSSLGVTIIRLPLLAGINVFPTNGGGSG